MSLSEEKLTTKIIHERKESYSNTKAQKSTTSNAAHNKIFLVTDMYYFFSSQVEMQKQMA